MWWPEADPSTRQEVAEALRWDDEREFPGIALEPAGTFTFTAHAEARRC